MPKPAPKPDEEKQPKTPPVAGDPPEPLEDDDEPETPPEPPKKKAAVNIMDPINAPEPPKKKKEKEFSNTMDLSPVLDKLTEGFAALDEKLAPKPAPEPEKSFLDHLGDW